MKWMKTLLIAFALIAGTSGIAAAQDWDDHDRDRDRDRDRGRWGYQDRDHDRDRDDRYRRGDGDYDRDDGYRNNRGVYGPYNQNPYYRSGMQQARENGYQWGMRDGRVDRQAGRSYRATSNETYREARRGYVSAYGDRSRYQAIFRQAYQDGYQRGYGSAGYGNGPYGGPYGRVPWGR